MWISVTIIEKMNKKKIEIRFCFEKKKMHLRFSLICLINKYEEIFLLYFNCLRADFLFVWIWSTYYLSKEISRELYRCIYLCLHLMWLNRIDYSNLPKAKTSYKFFVYSTENEYQTKKEPTMVSREQKNETPHFIVYRRYENSAAEKRFHHSSLCDWYIQGSNYKNTRNCE